MQDIYFWYFSATYNGESIPNLLLRLLSRDKPSEMQMAAAKCLTYLCRGGAIPTHCPTIQNKVWPQTICRARPFNLFTGNFHAHKAKNFPSSDSFFNKNFRYNRAFYH